MSRANYKKYFNANMSVGYFLSKLYELNLYMDENTEQDIFDIFKEMYNLYYIVLFRLGQARLN